MRAVRLVQPGQPLKMQDLPVPDVGSRDVLIRVKAAGICHSDVVTQTVPLDADAVNGVLDSLGRFERQIRTVITP
jgi:NADPH:quinone reductase-like Zn-dependent oxidoreductase